MIENERQEAGANADCSVNHNRATRFIELLTAHQRDLFVYINTLLVGDSSAIDVLQDTNLDLWARLQNFDESRPFLPWAYGFAFQRVLAFRKSRRRSRLVLNDDLVQLISDVCVQDTTPADARLTALRNCLEKLDPQQSQLICDRYIEKMSVKTIAARLGHTANQISARLYRIRQTLGRCIQASLVAEMRP
ncbi:MAG TPA: sigma-70 family RNA polymerase sigma factor [Pirellulales bacterium]|jgi:RNA polymerase sigma-70 factor (ECF subfamily)|nr:sigma-70 family RNA polymerase sigma factor [Pirellulales bacterium]